MRLRILRGSRLWGTQGRAIGRGYRDLTGYGQRLRI